MNIEGKEILLEILREKNLLYLFQDILLILNSCQWKYQKIISLWQPYIGLLIIFLNPFMEYLRKKYVCKYQIKKGLSGVKEAINYINKEYSIALMIDQRVGESDRYNFFDKLAHTTSLPAQLSIKFDLNVIPVFIKREKDNKFTIKFYEKINPKNFDYNKRKITEKLNKVLEQMVIKNPNQWIWTHDRWK